VVVVVVVHSFGARRERGVCGSARGESEREGGLFAYLLGSRAATAFIRSPVPRTSRATEAPRAAGALARGPLRAERGGGSKWTKIRPRGCVACLLSEGQGGPSPPARRLPYAGLPMTGGVCMGYKQRKRRRSMAALSYIRPFGSRIEGRTGSQLSFSNGLDHQIAWNSPLHGYGGSFRARKSAWPQGANPGLTVPLLNALDDAETRPRLQAHR
jgi:hypothetical protein